MKDNFYLNNELKHLSSEYRMSKELMGNLLDDKFLEVGKKGNLLSKSDIMEAMPLLSFEFKIENLTVIYDSDKFYQVIYDLVLPDFTRACSASWIKREDWKLLFFQATPRN